MGEDGAEGEGELQNTPGDALAHLAWTLERMAAISATPHAAEMASVSAAAPLSPRVPKVGQHRGRQPASVGPHAPPLGSGALTNGDVGVTSHIYHAMC